MIISQTLLQEPKCVLDLVVPDWSVCHRENPELEKLLKMTRIVTYTRGIGCQPGTLSCQFGHGKEDHILTSMAEFLPNALEVNVSYSSEYIRQFYRCHTHVFNLGTGNIPMETVEDVLVSNWKDLLPLRGQRMKALLPFDDEPIDTIKVRMIPFATPIYEHLRHIAVHSPLELMKIHAEGLNKDGRAVHQQQVEALNNALDLDRSAHLWLSWSQMPNLESVFLDLRLYSHDLNTERRCLSKLHVIARAQEMGRHLRLKTLLLAGLQSYSFETEYDGITAEHIENWNEIDGEPNWFKIFSPSVREGGKIILVDKLADSLQK
ncbi:hypothetical protein GGS21DRAFT_540309 [Xylaria nigripes]|nr:hypothetical protein GGS21DRAFT_540309 [Xylaria nigripes]